MKKTLFYLASFCIALAFTACTSDDGGGNVTPASITDESIVGEALGLTFDDPDAPYSQATFSETGKAILHSNDAPTAKRRASATKYIIGEYTLDGNVYTVYVDGSEYCTVEVTGTTGATTNVKIRQAGEEVFNGSAKIGDKIEADKATTTICREWEVVYAGLRHKNGVTATHMFDNPAEAASMNAILKYAKSVASIEEYFNENMFITSIEFVSDSTFCMYFANGENYIGKWQWADKSKGIISYNWYEKSMGNAFESGMVIFDIRQYKQAKYHTFTFVAEIENGSDSYTVELSFYMKELNKKKEK